MNRISLANLQTYKMVGIKNVVAGLNSKMQVNVNLETFCKYSQNVVVENLVADFKKLEVERKSL